MRILYHTSLFYASFSCNNVLVLHSLHRYPEPVIVDMEEMNAPVAETVKAEDQHHLVPDVLFFHEALYCPYIAFFKSCVQIFRNDQQRSFVESVVYDGIS